MLVARSTKGYVQGMVSLDVRTRSDDDVAPVDPEEFFGHQLPELAASREDLAIPGALELGVRPITVLTSAGAWTMAVEPQAIQITPGDQGAAVVRMDDGELTDIVHDLRTPMTFLTAGTLDVERGSLIDFLDWWVVLRSLVDGVAVHTAGAIEFRDRQGDPLDLLASFSVGDDPEHMAHFLAEAGYLHLREVFTEDEMAEVSADIDAATPCYRPDDGRSWWARTASGDDRVVRLQWFQEHSRDDQRTARR